MLILRLTIVVLATAALACFGSCTYPESGSFALVGVNRSGEWISFHPFMVEEITDDTTMTTDFVLLWPRDGDLIEVAIANGEEFNRREWSVAMDGSDLGAGTLELRLVHSSGKLYFAGDYQPLPGYPVWPLGGEVAVDPRSSWLELAAPLPPLPEALEQVTGFELLKITDDEFEEHLGMHLFEAKRLLASPAMITEVTEEYIPVAKSANRGDSTDDPPAVVGGRESNRPR